MHHLENTGSALAEDVLQKSTIIQQYYMENKAGAHSLCHVTAMVTCITPIVVDNNTAFVACYWFLLNNCQILSSGYQYNRKIYSFFPIMTL